MKFNIVTASDINLVKFINPCLESLRSCGYDPIFYNLGGLDFGIDFEANTSDKSLKKFPKKPLVIKDALSKLSYNDWLAWIDIDCIMKMSVDDAINDEYDVGITFRKNHINSGVSFWKNTISSINFLDHWAAESLIQSGDQNALNGICNIQSSEMINKTITIYNTKIKIFDSKIYNNFFFKKNQDNAKILHYKSKFRRLFPHGE
jgi:hypothetical protein